MPRERMARERMTREKMAGKASRKSLRTILPVAFVAGALSATGFAPLDWWPVALLCFALLLKLTHDAPSLPAALLRGWLFGLGHFIVGNNWIQHAFEYQDKMPPALGYAGVVLIAIYLALYPAIACGLAWRFARHFEHRERASFAFVLAAASAWIVTEWLRATMFTGYPWNPLGAIWLPVPGVANLAAWIGTYALAGIAILASGALYLASERRFAPVIAVSAALLAVALVLNPGAAPADPDRPLVRIVQPNVGQDAWRAADSDQRILNTLIAASGQPGAKPRLIVWPEGMVNYLVEDGYPNAAFYRADPRWVRAHIAAMLGPQDRALFGGNALFFDRKGTLNGAGNSVWPIDPTGMLGTRYDKAHLVPYGEYLPMRPLLEPLGLARFVMGDIDYVPGPGPQSIDVSGFGRAGIAICYEIIFSGQIINRANRPDFIYNPSNDAWFGGWGPPQHLAQARLRAIEEGLPILRATPNGISAVIDGHGRVLGSIPHHQQGAIELPLPRPLAPTLFARAGNWLAFLVAFLFIAMAVALRRRAR